MQEECVLKLSNYYKHYFLYSWLLVDNNDDSTVDGGAM